MGLPELRDLMHDVRDATARESVSLRAAARRPNTRKNQTLKKKQEDVMAKKMKTEKLKFFTTDQLEVPLKIIIATLVSLDEQYKEV